MEVGSFLLKRHLRRVHLYPDEGSKQKIDENSLEYEYDNFPAMFLSPKSWNDLLCESEQFLDHFYSMQKM